MATPVSPVIYAEPDQIRAAKQNAEHVERVKSGDVHMKDTMQKDSTQVNSGSTSADQLVSKPRRKFAPEPVETMTRSSKPKSDMDTPPSKRKFVVEPVETTMKSSKTREQPKEEKEKPQRARKFAVEPVETTMVSSKDREKKTDSLENGARPKRCFADEPVETSTRNSKENEEDTKTAKPRRKFAVEPVETSTGSSRKKKEEKEVSSDDASSTTPSRSSSSGRKFTPELVGTAKASYRKKPSVESAVPKWLKADLEEESSWSAPEPQESKFSAKNLAKKARKDPRRHSYSVPDLPIIESDSSEEESLTPQTPVGMSHSYSADHVPQQKTKHKHSHSHLPFMPDLQTLREQAVAAYGSQEDRIPFGHYGGDSDDEDYSMSIGKLSVHDGADPQLFRRMSHHDIHLVQEDMRRHHAQLERAKEDLREDTAGISRFSAAALAARHHLHISHPAGSHYKNRHETEQPEVKPPVQSDDEFSKMRKAASPPMQGDEIKFPFSLSPKMTRCDTDQMPRPRRANSEDEEEHDIGVPGMWSAHISPMKNDAAAGLWGGLCQKGDAGPTRPTTPLRSGLQTPAFERDNPFGSRTPGHGAKTPRRGGGGALWGSNAFMPLTPPRSRNEKANDGFTAALDQKLLLERQIDDEFHPRVITQIYNYLSLGYPPIARPFDEELSKISRIPISELRKGDRSHTGSMKGHVGVPEGEGDAEEDDDGRVKGCRRWDALKLYVREWARQSPLFQNEQKMIANTGTGMWGNNAPVRKGSWGF